MLETVNFVLERTLTMKATVLMLLIIPTKRLLLAQTMPAQAIPDLRNLLDFGVTAVLAIFMIWIYSKQTGDWQKQFMELSKFHETQMSSLTDRYEKQTDQLKVVLAENNVIKGKLLEAIERLLKVSPCPYAQDLDDHPASRNRRNT